MRGNRGISDSPGGVGSTFYWEEEGGSSTYKLHFETTEWVENEVFGYRMTSGDFFKSYNERWTVLGIVLGVEVLFIIYLMVFKPALWG